MPAPVGAAVPPIGYRQEDDVVHRGCGSWSEPIEVKVAEAKNATGKAAGQEMLFQCQRVKEGSGRMLMILRAVLCSFTRLREKLGADLELNVAFRTQAATGFVLSVLIVR